MLSSSNVRRVAPSAPSSSRANTFEEREGTVRLEQILATRPGYLATATGFDLLVAVPRIGPVKAAHLLNLAHISPSKTVVALSERQHPRLIELLSC